MGYAPLSTPTSSKEMSSSSFFSPLTWTVRWYLPRRVPRISQRSFHWPAGALQDPLYGLAWVPMGCSPIFATSFSRRLPSAAEKVTSTASSSGGGTAPSLCGWRPSLRGAELRRNLLVREGLAMRGILGAILLLGCAAQPRAGRPYRDVPVVVP